MLNQTVHASRPMRIAVAGATGRVGVVGVIDVVCAGAIDDDGVVPGPDPSATRLEDQAAAPVHHRCAIPSHVGAEQLS